MVINEQCIFLDGEVETGCFMQLNEYDIKKTTKKYFICKRGNSYIPIRSTELYIFYVVSKVTFVKDKAGNKYTIEKSLSELEEQLDKKVFFRANRKVFLNVNAIREYKMIEFGKIAISVKDKEFKNEIIVSQVTAPLFKKWINDL